MFDIPSNKYVNNEIECSVFIHITHNQDNCHFFKQFLKKCHFGVVESSVGFFGVAFSTGEAADILSVRHKQ